MRVSGLGDEEGGRRRRLGATDCEVCVDSQTSFMQCEDEDSRKVAESGRPLKTDFRVAYRSLSSHFPHHNTSWTAA